MCSSYGAASRMCVATIFVLLLWTGEASLNIGTDAVEGLADDVRQFIFMDIAYFTERPKQRCSSLDGPSCFSFMAGQTGGQGVLTGLLPDQMLHDFGDLERSAEPVDLPFHAFHQVKAQVQAAMKEGSGALISADELTSLQGEHADATSHGVLHFADLQPDRRVPLTFSRGLPSQVIATWDGKWIARHSGTTEVNGMDAASMLALPAGGMANLPGLPEGTAVATHEVEDLIARPAAASGVTATAELASSLGYLRFSQPLVIRSLFARWAKESKTPAVIAGRRGSDTVWSSYFEAGQSRNSEWVDITGGSLQPVDEVLIIGSGVELGAMWVVSSDGSWSIAMLDAEEANKQAADEPRSVLMLTPTQSQEKGAGGADKPAFTVRIEQVQPEAAPFLISLHEAARRNLRLQVDPAKWGLPHSHGSSTRYPSLITTSTPQQLWTPAATQSHMLMEHQVVATWIAAGGRKDLGNRAGAVVTALEGASGIPSDVQKLIKQDHGACVEALQALAEQRLEQAELIEKLQAQDVATQLEQATAALLPSSEHKARRTRANLDMLAAAFLHTHRSDSALAYLIPA